MEKFDLTVIGSGPGGYIAAFRASQLGMRVALVERKELGGLCLNLGCIPSKAILKSAEVFAMMKNASKYGLSAENVSVDYGKVVERSRKVAARLSRGVEFLVKKNKVTAFSGTARLTGPTRLVVERPADAGGNCEIESARVILATGTEPRSLSGLDADGKTIMNSDQAILSRERPASVAVIGGGAVGVEFAYWYNAFGSKVTIIELMEQLLPNTDREIADQLRKSLTRQGISVLTSAKVRASSKREGKVAMEVELAGEKRAVDAELVLVAVGRSAVVKELGLDEAGVELKNGYISVDEQYRTSCLSIYAIGDVIGPPLLAHAASAEGVAAVEMMTGKGRGPVDPWKIPSCIYCQPEVATIGLSEQDAEAKGISVKVGRFPFRASGRAIASGDEEGIVKIIADEKYGEILGAHMIGKGVTELIAEIGLGQTVEATSRDLHSTIHAHPTLAEAIGEAALDLDKLTLNI
ncbi:MAG: dihydrolipoyl dehydrogenase [Deltaproteobacteria bacterium]|nr:dihydrolipoyl dehydrogenase [Deltaproteobacteria bacterium]